MDKPFGFECRHAAKACGRDCLTIRLVRDIAGREHAGYRGGGRVWCDLDIARRFQFQLAGDEFCRRRMPDRDKDAVGRQIGAFASFDVLQPDVGDLRGVLVAANLFDGGVPDHLDFGMLEQPVLQDAFGTQRAAAMHQGDLGGKIGQEQRFLDRGVAAADHENLLAAVEEPVAGGASGDAEALEGFLGGEAEPAGLGAGGEDDRVGEIHFAGVAGDAERSLPEFQCVDVIGDDPGTDVCRLLFHLLHQPRSLDDVGEAWIVLDIGGDGELSARLDALDQHWLKHRARGVNSGSVAGGAGPDDDDLGVVGGGLACRGLVCRRHGSILTPPSTDCGEAETAQKDGCGASKTAKFILGYLGSHASYATHIHRFSDISVTYQTLFADWPGFEQ